jgi:hypothetical protein
VRRLLIRARVGRGGRRARDLREIAAPRWLMATGRRVRRRAPHGRCAGRARRARRGGRTRPWIRGPVNVSTERARDASRSGDAVVYLLGDEASGNYPRTR